MTHPCQFSPEVIEVLRDLIHADERVHDPFAGTGVRLAALCDELGVTFTGSDIEPWPDSDRRVWVGDATSAHSYPVWPLSPVTIVTSPVYQNKRCADYANGPTPNTKTKGRRDYGIALGRALHPDNLARYTGRPAWEEAYYTKHWFAVSHWGHRAIVNVDLPIQWRWEKLLESRGYAIKQVIPAYTKRYRGLHNAEKRAEYEVVIEATK